MTETIGPRDGRPTTRAVPTAVWQVALYAVVGVVAGAASGMNRLTGLPVAEPISQLKLAAYPLIGAAIGLVAALLLRWGMLRLIAIQGASVETARGLAKVDALTTLFLLFPLLGAIGVQFVPIVLVFAFLAFVAIKAVTIYAVLSPAERSAVFASLGWLSFLFLISGFAALIYQIVWQRVMFSAFGVNIESITVIVSLFMFGLGLGSLLGGVVARKFPGRAPLLFLICELSIGAFGVVSIPLIKAVSAATLHGSLATVSLAILALLCLPTMLMGATLPILVGHLFRHYRNVGKSVGLLYCINTIGSALACFVTADVLFVLVGEQASVLFAAMCNLVAGVLVMRYARRIARTEARSTFGVEEKADSTFDFQRDGTKARRHEEEAKSRTDAGLSNPH